MKVILTSTDLSFVQSAQIALDAQDIPSVLSSDNATGLPPSPSTLAVVDDQDFDRAVAVLGGLQRTPPKPWGVAASVPRVLLILLLLLAVAVCGVLVF